MRDISKNAQRLIDSGAASFVLLTIEAKNATLRHTTLPYDAEVPDVGVFNSDCGLVSLDSPRLSSAVDKETYKIGYIDPEFSLRALVENNLTGCHVIAKIGFFNNLGTDIVGSTTGRVFSHGMSVLDSGDLVTSYEGTIDAPAYEISSENGVMLKLTCGSPMSALDMTNVFYTSKDSLNQRVFKTGTVTNDTAFDNVYVGSTAIMLNWGKIAQ